jgi:hypothetical protein
MEVPQLFAGELHRYTSLLNKSISGIQMDALLPYLQAASHISGVIIAIAAIYGINQIRLMKIDMSTRSERAAKEKAIEYSEKYLHDYVGIDLRFLADCQEEDLGPYDGPIGDFSPDSVPDKYIDSAEEKFALGSWLPAVNLLEAIASAFTKGVADEKVGFNIIGRTFCSTVAHKYDIISLSRSDDVSPHYQDIVELYSIWSSRLSKAELEEARDDLEEKVSEIDEEEIDHISPNV